MTQRKFFRSWCLASLLVALGIVLFNISMDPYLIFGIPRISGINSKKPAIDSEFWLMKAYDVRRYAPKTILLGPSPIAVGLRGQSPLWKSVYRPVYNLATPLSGPYVSYRYLQHAMAMGNISLVVLGLQFSYFVNKDADDMFESQNIEPHLLVNRDGSRNPKFLEERVRAMAYASLSFRALQDSGAELIGNFRGDSSDLVRGDYDWVAARETPGADSYAAVFWSDIRITWMNRRASDHLDPKAMEDVRAILDLCEWRGVSVIVFVNPIYVDVLENLDLAGYWPLYESWERNLVTLISQYPNRRSGAPGAFFQLWDFSGYDSYSIGSDIERWRWFADFVHYRTEVGDAIIRTFMGEPQNGFGVLLTEKTIESHLAKVREQRELYRREHPVDAQRLRSLHALVVNSRSN